MTELKSISKSENDVLALFLIKDKAIIRSPSEVDIILGIGMINVIDIFLELESIGYLKWCSLNLLDLDLGRSTKEIYQEVYNSQAQLTSQGRNFLGDSTSKAP